LIDADGGGVVAVVALDQAGRRTEARQGAHGRLLTVQIARARTGARDGAGGRVSALGLAIAGAGAHEGDADAARARGSAGGARRTVHGHLDSGAHVHSAVRAAGTAGGAGTHTTRQVAAFAHAAATGGRADVAESGVESAAVENAAVQSASVELPAIGARVRYGARVHADARIRRTTIGTRRTCATCFAATLTRTPAAGWHLRRTGRPRVAQSHRVVKRYRIAIDVDAEEAAADGAGQGSHRQTLPGSATEGRRGFHLGSATRVTRARTGTRKLTSFASAGNCTRRPAFSRQLPSGVAPIAGGSTLT